MEQSNYLEGQIFALTIAIASILGSLENKYQNQRWGDLPAVLEDFLSDKANLVFASGFDSVINNLEESIKKIRQEL